MCSGEVVHLLLAFNTSEDSVHRIFAFLLFVDSFFSASTRLQSSVAQRMAAAVFTTPNPDP